MTTRTQTFWPLPVQAPDRVLVIRALPEQHSVLHTEGLPQNDSSGNAVKSRFERGESENRDFPGTFPIEGKAEKKGV